MTAKSTKQAATKETANVFADLGLPDADELLAKARLASTIADLIEKRGLTQTEAAALLETTQPKVSNLVNGRLEGFSLERLTRFLNTLGRDVEIVVRPQPRSGRAARTVVRTTSRRSPLDVPGVDTRLSTDEIVAAVRESRTRQARR